VTRAATEATHRHQYWGADLRDGGPTCRVTVEVKNAYPTRTCVKRATDAVRFAGWPDAERTTSDEHGNDHWPLAFRTGARPQVAGQRALATPGPFR
jgi:hypothetical protein